MVCQTLVLALCSTVFGTSRASPAGERSPAPAALQPGDPPADGTSLPSGDINGTDVNPNNLFGNACARGLVRVQGECVFQPATTSRPPRRPPLPPGLLDQPEYDATDDDDFLRQLGFDADSLVPAAVEPAGAPALVPAPRPGPVAAAPGVAEFVDSLSDEEFLRELLRDSGGESRDASPTSCPGRLLYRRGLVLVTAGSVLLVLALLLAAWTTLRWRRRSARVAVTV